MFALSNNLDNDAKVVITYKLQIMNDTIAMQMSNILEVHIHPSTEHGFLMITADVAKIDDKDLRLSIIEKLTNY